MQNRIPLVSVIVGTYNHENYIAKCLDSIIMQKTNFPFEIILGEDNSSDKTREICKQYAAKYPKIIKLFLRKREDVIYINNRPTGRYNFIENLKAASSNYLALCDGDDYWIDAYKLQKQFDFLNNNFDYSLCASRVMEKHETGKKHLDYIPVFKEYYSIEDLLLYVNFIKTVSTFFRREHLNLDDPILKKVPFADLYFWLKLSENKKIKILPDVTACYRIHSTGVWRGIDDVKRNESYILFMQLMKKSLPKKYHQLCNRRIRILKWQRFKMNVISLIRK